MAEPLHIENAMRWAVVLLFLCGCAESFSLSGGEASSPDALPPVQAQNNMFPPVDTFWLQQSVAQMREPKPLPVRSISLGYIGDAPLTGGVMNVQQEQQQQPCACSLR